MITMPVKTSPNPPRTRCSIGQRLNQAGRRRRALSVGVGPTVSLAGSFGIDGRGAGWSWVADSMIQQDYCEEYRSVTTDGNSTLGATSLQVIFQRPLIEAGGRAFDQTQKGTAVGAAAGREAAGPRLENIMVA